MQQKPLFVATHPRACSTAFERVFMTRRDTLQCVHEPFGDAYYFGPERMAERYAQDAQQREKSGFSQSTYHIIMEGINRDNTEGKRLFIKDMALYLFPPSQGDTSIAPSLLNGTHSAGSTRSHTPDSSNGPHTPDGITDHYQSNGIDSIVLDTKVAHKRADSGAHFVTQAEWDAVEAHSSPASPRSPFNTFTEIENPTVVPTSLLKQFQFVFLIRHPRYSIPSYYRCCIPPLVEMTGFTTFRPDEMGYEELRRFFDYCRLSGQIGPNVSGEKKSVNGASINLNDICVLDADDMLNNPEQALSTFCESARIDWQEKMLHWSAEDDEVAIEMFEKWKGWHEDALHSHDLKARTKRHIKTDEELYDEWVSKYGKDAANVIQKTVAENVEHYEYLKQFAIKVKPLYES